MPEDDRQALLQRARDGDNEARGQLLDSFGPYVRVIARSVRNGRLKGRFGESDLIQDALLEAHRSFDSFRGATEAEFVAWLRQIVVRTVGHAVRANLDAGKRDANREQSASHLSGIAVDTGTSPSGVAIRHEESARLAAALEQLPEEMREVILARHVEDVPYAELAQRLGRKEPAVRMLYVRAIRRMKEVCGADDGSHFE